MDAFMGAPTHPLLGAADNYSFPMTSGLLGSLSQQQPTDWTQVALQLAGNPHAGPYANAQGLPSSSGSPLPSAGSTSGGSPGAQIAGGLLGTLEKNPSLVKNGVNAIEGLLGGGLGAYGSGAAADAAVTGALGSVGAQTAGEAAAIQAANDAALGGSAAAGSGAAGGAAAGSGAGASGAGSSALGVAGALAIPAAIAALGFMGDEGDYGLKNISGLLGKVKDATAQGLISPNDTAAGSLDPRNPAAWQAITALNQSQLGPGGSYGKYSDFGTQGLNALGYQTLQQQAKALGITGAGLGGPGGLAYGTKIQSF